MMRRTFSIILIAALIGSNLISPVSAEYSPNYEQYLDEANRALSVGEYDRAIRALKDAHRVTPSNRYPLEKIKAIQTLLMNDERSFHKQEKLRLVQELVTKGQRAIDSGDYKAAIHYFQQASQIVGGGMKPVNRINLAKRISEGRVMDVSDKAPLRKRIPPDVSGTIRKAPSSKPGIYKSSSRQEPLMLSLDDKLWSTQPKTPLQLQQGSAVVFEGNNIQRFVVITPGVVNVERVDRGRLKLTAVQVGTTFIHLWDDRGRWTFHVQAIFPAMLEATKSPEPKKEKRAQPFMFSYAIDGGTLYRGDRMRTAERDSLNMQQTLGIKGETPYGVADGSISYYKFAQSTEATNYTVGLSGVKGLGFSGVNLRGYDAVKYFSPLTFPGQYFRGFLIEGKAAQERIEAAYVHGQDRFTYSYISPGVVEDRRSYIEGARVTLFPNREDQYSFNYARGYGDARQDFLKNQVYSLEVQQRIAPVLLNAELATNTDTLAETLSAKLGSDRRLLRLNFRDIDRDFTTITGLPSNLGEIGMNVGLDLDYDSFDVNSSLDFYRDRFLPNAEDPDALNSDFNTSVRFSLGQKTDLLSVFYYLHTPGEISPRRSFRWMNTLSQRFKIWADKELSVFAGAGYHRNRVGQTPISEYDRYTANTGLQLGLIRHLSYFLNYEYSWVDERLSGDFVHPGVLNTGLNYARQIAPKTFGRASIYYRDEQNAVGANSFLAGEDSITGSLGLSFRPTTSAELFLDSRVRNVWKENPDNPAYNEIDVRWGLRSQWELPLIWSPSGSIQGIVFKDLDGDGYRDDDEPGIPDILVRVATREATSDARGRYKQKVRAKSVVVAPDLSTVPQGYVMTTPATVEVEIPHRQDIDFGFNVQSGIYGIVFFDHNNDGRPDNGDTAVQSVRIILNGKTAEVTDYDGTYFFKDLVSGRHTLRLDVNSLPIEYLPLVKLVNTLEVSEGTTSIFHIPLKKKAVVDDQSGTNEMR